MSAGQGACRRGAIWFAMLIGQLMWSSGHQTVATEPFREFLQALQDRGYGDTAADYLTVIRSRDDLPEDLHEVLDLEMATSLRIAAANTPNADEAARSLGAAQQFLDKFVREHPDHPESGMAYSTYGDLASARAEAWLKAGLASRDTIEQESLLKKARQAFEEAAAVYDRGRDACQARLDRLKKEAGTKGIGPAQERPDDAKSAGESASDAESVEGRLVQVRFKRVMVDYQIAKTYLDTTSPERKEAMGRAAAGFDDIYQRYRTFQAGLYSHFWHGKTLVDLGDLTTALDVFDEVLANSPEPNERSDDVSFDELFAQVEEMRLTILSRQGHTEDVITEAEEWLRLNKANQRSDRYQGVALQLAKALLVRAEGQTGDARRKTTQTVKVGLSKIAAKANAHQQEAILMQRQLRSQGDDTGIGTFDEAVAVADAAVTAGDWETAIANYERAIHLSRNDKKGSSPTDVRLRLARAQWSAGKVADCLETAERLVEDESAGEQASAAAALAIHAALKLAAASREPAAQERLTAVADAIVRRWPQSVEADEARMALGKMALVKGDEGRALDVFERVNSASQRHPSALHWSAVVHWRRYLRAKTEPDDKRDEAAMSAERDRAIGQLTASIKAQAATAVSGAPPRELMESQVLLAEIELEGGKPDEAADLVGPLVAVVRALPPSEQDALGIRALLAALRAQILRKDVQHGDEAATALIERGGDSPQAGAVLLEFARLLRREIAQTPAAEPSKPAEAAQPVPPSDAGQAPETLSAEAPPAPQGGPNREALVLTLTKILEYIGQRPQSSAGSMIFVAETLAELGKDEQARSQYQAILERAEKDPHWLQVDRSLKTRVRAKLLSVLRSEGKYEQALAQADRLVQESPRAMEPRMERAQILQSWAESEPDRYAQAVAQWTELRTALQNVRPRPKEYYDVLYNAAWCLAAQSEHSGDKGLARQAEQLLKSSLILSPSLNGPETVTKYNALLERCLGLQAEKSKAKSGSQSKTKSNFNPKSKKG
ncbi:MAG TPA: hypothetical protein VG826_21515 [Pirellulales bacterium]|nr:hypothetical protein [Pirellulales bacterium]